MMFMFDLQKPRGYRNVNNFFFSKILILLRNVPLLRSLTPPIFHCIFSQSPNFYPFALYYSVFPHFRELYTKRQRNEQKL